MFVLKHKYGLEGIGFFTNLMRMLTVTPHHHLCIAEPGDSLYVFSKIGIDEERGISMINDMVKTKKIHQELWEKYRVIVSPDHLKSLEPLYAQRSNDIITIEEIISMHVNPPVAGFTPMETHLQRGLQGDSMPDNPQSKAKQSKVKQSKAKQRKSQLLLRFHYRK